MKLSQNGKLMVLGIMEATGMDIAEHLMKLAKVTPTSFFIVSYAQGK